MRLNEEWREGEDDDCVVGAILMDNYADGNNLSSAWARTLSDVIKVA